MVDDVDNREDGGDEDVVVAVLDEGMYGMGIAKLRGVWVVLSEYRSSSLGLDFFIVKM